MYCQSFAWAFIHLYVLENIKTVSHAHLQRSYSEAAFKFALITEVHCECFINSILDSLWNNRLTFKPTREYYFVSPIQFSSCGYINLIEVRAHNIKLSKTIRSHFVGFFFFFCCLKRKAVKRA